MNKLDETIMFLKNKDDIFAAKYDETIEKIKKSRTPEGADIEVTIEGMSPMPEDEEGYPISSRILTRITIKEGKTITVLTIANISREMLRMQNYTTNTIAKIESSTKRLIGRKKKVYISRIANVDDAFMYYGEEEGAVMATLHKEIPVEYIELSNIAEIGRYHRV